MNGRPAVEPLGLALGRVAKLANKAFSDALAHEGGSLHVWLILLALKTGAPETQRELAARVGIEGATLTHHLTGLERDGIVVRERLPENRRVQAVRLTDEGEALFLRLRGAAIAFDTRLRAGLSAEELEAARAVLGRLEENVRAG